VIAVRHRLGSLAAVVALALLSALVGAVPARADELELPVPRAAVYPGDVISDDLLFGRMFIAHTVTRSSVFEVREAVVGKVARRTLLPGQPIPINAVRDPYVVTQGKQALVVFRSDGLTITTYATPLQSGGAGDVISVRNIDSGSIIKGTVEADGTISVGAK
jgi:flagella basal body P-ring formation protein FlgA